MVGNTDVAGRLSRTRATLRRRWPPQIQCGRAGTFTIARSLALIILKDRRILATFPFDWKGCENPSTVHSSRRVLQLVADVAPSILFS